MTSKSRHQVEKEIRDLRRQIDKHNYQYYVLDDPLISDAEYDEMFRRLLELEKERPDLAKADSPTQRVGAPPLDKFKTVQHTLPMLSLSNANDQEETHQFEERIQRFLKTTEAIEYAAEPKIDGVAVELVYDEGRFVVGSTRGGGIIWGGITPNP